MAFTRLCGNARTPISEHDAAECTEQYEECDGLACDGYTMNKTTEDGNDKKK
jgi:hypothetical protein